MPCACQPYAVLVVFHVDSVGRGGYLRQEERGLVCLNLEPGCSRIRATEYFTLGYSCSGQPHAAQNALARAPSSCVQPVGESPRGNWVPPITGRGKTKDNMDNTHPPGKKCELSRGSLVMFVVLILARTIIKISNCQIFKKKN